MPAPTNISALTATALGALPATATQRVDFSGTTYTVWYSFVAPAACLVISAFGFGDLAVYEPTIRPYDGPASAPVQILSIAGPNVPIQVPVTAGSTYYLELTPNGGNPTPANLTLSVQAAPTLPTASGSILMNDDVDGFPLIVLDGTTGSAQSFVAPFPSGEGAAILTNGIMLIEDRTAGQAVLYSPTFALVGRFDKPTGGTGFLHLASNHADRFYLATAANRKVGTVSSTGVVGATIWTPTGTTIGALGVAQNDTVLYYAPATVGAAVQRWDLVNNIALANLAAGIANYQVQQEILVLADETILVGYYKAVAGADSMVKHYATDGTVLATYALGAIELFRLADAIDDPTSFWALATPNPGSFLINRYLNIVVAGGAIRTTINADVYSSGIYQPSATATPTRFGPSESCTFLIARATPTTTTTHPIRRLRQTAHLSTEQLWLFFSKFQLDCEAGVGLVTGQGSDPQVMLSWSDDGGHTWSAEQWMSAGLIGEYKRRVIWRRLGRSRDRVWRIVVSDPVAWRLLAAYIDVKKGTS